MMTGWPVHWWPARLAEADEGVFVIGLSGDGERVGARRRIRVALREALAQLTGVQAADIAIESVPGSAPSVSFASRVRTRAHAVPGIAITHDGALSLAAINLHGPVGIDLMQVQEIPELDIVARDYLGPVASARLDAHAPAERAAAFARAWTEHEARLKCCGLQLAEWTAGAQRQADGVRCVPLALRDGLVGTLAIPSPSAMPNG